MFYDRFVALCAQRGESPSRAALNAGISKAVVSKWKQNPAAFPSGAVVEKLTAYFGVSVTDLLKEDASPAGIPPRLSSGPVPLNPNSPAGQGKTAAEAQAETEEPGTQETFYERFARISRSYGVSPSKAAVAAGLSKSSVSKWKREPESIPTGTALSKLAAYFGIPAADLLPETPKASHAISDEAVKFALFGGSEDITQEMYNEVRSFAAFVKEREAKKRGKE